MNSPWDQRPAPDEYGSFYQRYIDKLNDDNIINQLTAQHHRVYDLIISLTEEQALYRYEPDKWTVKEVIGHLIDTERVFTYRALSFSRNDTHELPGFDQDAYVKEADFNARSLQSLASEYGELRNSNIQLFKSYTEEVLDRRGTANNTEISVRAIPFIIAGHERHHLELLTSRYKISPG